MSLSFVDLRNSIGYGFRMDTELRILHRLNGRRFDQDDLTRIGVSSDTVMNYERKTGLLLCSPPPGRGRARKFCLLDAYLLRLTSEVISMTGSAIHAVRAVNCLFMSDFEEYPDTMPPEEEFIQYKDEVQDNIFSAHPVFSERHAESYVYTENIEHGLTLADIHRPFDPFYHGSRKRRRILFFNVTQIFIDIDEQLANEMDKRYGRDSW